VEAGQAEWSDLRGDVTIHYTFGFVDRYENITQSDTPSTRTAGV